jgi:histidinol-phosphate phosphatase family protein
VNSTGSVNLQAVFLDRDGTIGGTGHFMHPRDFVPYAGAIESILALKRAGLKVFAFTHQETIGLGQVTLGEFEEQFRSYGLDGAFICPHSTKGACDCRKPAPGLLLRAAEEHNLDLTKCVVIGDTGGRDMVAAAAVGAIKVLVRTGWGESSLVSHRKSWAHIEPDYIADDLNSAVQWVLRMVDSVRQSPVGDRKQ